MRKLGRANYILISRGVKTYGTFNPDEIMFLFEEELYVDEYDTIYDFLMWCHVEGKGFGHGNYEERFSEFLLTEKA